MANDPHNSPAIASTLKAGAALTDITPRRSVGMTGYMLREGPSNGVLDPLFARALYLEHGGKGALLVSCDLLGLKREFANQARRRIEGATGIPASDILLSCTHTHSGPATMELLECARVEQDYLDWLQESLLEVAQTAKAGAVQAQARAGKSRLAGIQENRRTPGGPVDTDLLVLAIERLDGSPLAVMVNFACHPTCLQASNRLISGDYPGYAMSLVRETTSAVPMFFNGAAGNIRPVQRGSEVALRATGGAVAAGVLEMLPSLVDLEIHGLSVFQAELQVPLQKAPSANEIESVRFRTDRPVFYAPERTPQMELILDRLLAAWRANTLAARQSGRMPTHVPVEVQVIRLGPVTWVSFPGELFVELGLEIKQRLGREFVFLCGYSNGAIGYIPTRQAFEQGGYEVEEAYILHNYPAALAPEAGEQIVETAVRLSQALPA